MLHSVSVSSSNSPSRTGLRLLSGSASAENLKDGSKKDPRYDEDFIDIEIHQLTQLFNDHFDINDSEMMFGAGFGGGGGAATGNAEEAAPVVEKTVFELKLAGFDEKSKIKIIKEIRAITGLGLKEAKELVEGAPKIVKKDIKKAEAEELKGKLEAVGAVVEIV